MGISGCGNDIRQGSLAINNYLRSMWKMEDKPLGNRSMTEGTIDHSRLCELVETGIDIGAHIVGQPGGWSLSVRNGGSQQILAAQRSRQVRLFRRFETLVTYLKGVGIAHFDVDAENYAPDSSPAAVRRPDRSLALKHTHRAAAYDQWFREQVLASIQDPRESISHEEASAEFAMRKAALRRAES